jgi:hypothetical protein
MGGKRLQGARQSHTELSKFPCWYQLFGGGRRGTSRSARTRSLQPLARGRNDSVVDQTVAAQVVLVVTSADVLLYDKFP